jgi:thioredoxin reductase (NADPH)
MAAQGLQYGAQTCLGEKVMRLERGEDGSWGLGTHVGRVHRSRTVLITAGAGGFAPRRLNLPRLGEFEGRGVHYFVKDQAQYEGKRILIVGGGDSAVDWALHLEPVARKVSLIHRRDRFRAHEESVRKLLSSSVDVKLFWELAELHGNGRLAGCAIQENRTGDRQEMEIDAIILSLGFVADLGPVKEWGLAMHANGIKVSSRMETNLPGVYAAGDVATYGGKLKLIATGVGEAAIAVNYAKVFIDPHARAFPGHSSDLPR